jgi:hypothetical protein
LLTQHVVLQKKDVKHRREHNPKKAARRTRSAKRQKTKNLINKIHKKNRKFLVDPSFARTSWWQSHHDGRFATTSSGLRPDDQYHTIILPKIETQKMIFRKNRRIISKIVGVIPIWARSALPYRFRAGFASDSPHLAVRQQPIAKKENNSKNNI